ncbi:phosphoribosylanthranilate isomerase [Paracoccus shanxieyensis]|uniref:N-(5'-phosphoribosyl)anthranilate isomerase n=1 Tax=Paracoccus shanxieyensis TaxID=2675752 RepID=A0A6L6IZ24_9RHOB|nr:phosphoribosylanthranilate isomerase [Paracoccus shanxieyensis]MTH63844.1 phosphoribosylanthranilate isomerase [Paracoccus shanxieyensis]MTH86644.1 phosphoribosylanthranilate isomerase [Paracoccus shanxieyensis]
MSVSVKICGLTRPDGVDAAVKAGARYLGFVFFPKSPRHVTAAEAAALAADVPLGIARVGLFVNPDDALLESTLASVPLDVIQLHGGEDPARVAEVKALTGLPVMKAVGVAEPKDLDALWDYGLVADMLLIDAKPPKDADLPGGNGLAFDWRLLAGRQILKPWLLAGGLTPDNVSQALRLTRAQGVDVSSGVESAPGIKDPDLIRSFIARATAPIL